jgi:hypothetical protein
VAATSHLKSQSERQFIRPRSAEILLVLPGEWMDGIFKQATVTFFAIHPNSQIRTILKMYPVLQQRLTMNY